MTLDFQIAQRQLNNKTGVKYRAKITLVSGAKYDAQGRVWVTVLGASENNSTNIRNTPIALPIRPGVGVTVQEGRIVDIQEYAGRDFIAGNNYDDIAATQMSPRQLNPLDETKRFNLIEDLVNGSSFPSSGANYNVTVNGTMYQKPDGTYGMYNGQIVDLTSYVPATSNTQVVACIWLNPDSNTASVTASSEVSQVTNLRLAANNQTTIDLINECQASAPTGALGTWSYVLKSTDTKTTLQNKLWDIRGIYGAGGGSQYGTQKVISTAVSISSGYQGLLKGELIIEAGGSFTIAAGGEMVIL